MTKPSLTSPAPRQLFRALFLVNSISLTLFVLLLIWTDANEWSALAIGIVVAALMAWVHSLWIKGVLQQFARQASASLEQPQQQAQALMVEPGRTAAIPGRDVAGQRSPPPPPQELVTRVAHEAKAPLRGQPVALRGLFEELEARMRPRLDEAFFRQQRLQRPDAKLGSRSAAPSVDRRDRDDRAPSFSSAPRRIVV